MSLRVFLPIFISAFNGLFGFAQTIHGVTITPSNPSTANIINIVADFTYSGNCTFGHVGTHTFITANTVTVMPFYCGYGDTTVCHRTDTFKIGPLPQGSYHLKLDFHQGSICPISNFDAPLAFMDTVFNVSPVAGLFAKARGELRGTIQPNPTSGFVTVSLLDADPSKIYHLKLFDLLNGDRGTFILERDRTDLEIRLPPAVYFAQIVEDGTGIYFCRMVVIQ